MSLLNMFAWFYKILMQEACIVDISIREYLYFICISDLISSFSVSLFLTNPPASYYFPTYPSILDQNNIEVLLSIKKIRV